MASFSTSEKAVTCNTKDGIGLRESKKEMKFERMQEVIVYFYHRAYEV
jgi:hypothetical protein